LDDIGQLLTIEKIKKLKARYFRAVDFKDWDLLRTVFAEDVLCDFRGAATDPRTGFNPVPEATGAVIHGIEDAVAAFEASGAHFTSVHHGHMPEIEIISDSQASGIWALFDMLRFNVGPIAEIAAYGHYYETYEKAAGEWRIKTIRLTRLRVDTVART
jgi:hypothetical protein